MKLKTKPSARIKKRYLLINGNKENIEKAILDYIGILGYAKASPVFVERNGKIILAIAREQINEVRSAFEAADFNIKIIRISGTLKGLEK